MMALLLLSALFAFWVTMLCLHVYGIYTSFSKKWYIGAVAMFVPGFALIVGTAKLIFKKDLLK